MRGKNVAMAWIDYKKLIDMTPQRWIDSLKMYQITDKIIKFMKNWRVKLIARGKSLTKVKIQRGIFQGDVLSPLLFEIVMIPPNPIIRKCTGGYKLAKSQDKIWHIKMCNADNEKRKKTNDIMITTKRRQMTSTWEYWKRSSSNKWRWKKNSKKVSQEN